MANEGGAAERPEVVKQQLGGAPALGKGLAQLLHAGRQCDRVASAAQALLAQLKPLWPHRERTPDGSPLSPPRRSLCGGVMFGLHNRVAHGSSPPVKLLPSPTRMRRNTRTTHKRQPAFKYPKKANKIA